MGYSLPSPTSSRGDRYLDAYAQSLDAYERLMSENALMAGADNLGEAKASGEVTPTAAATAAAEAAAEAAMHAAKAARLAKAQQVCAAKVAPSIGMEKARPVIPQSAAAREFIAATLAELELFADVSAVDVERIIDAMLPRDAAAGEAIITQGDSGDHFFIVQTGTYHVMLKQVGRTPVHTYKSGGFFGELALLYDKPRAASVVTHEAGTLYQLDRDTFMDIVT